MIEAGTTGPETEIGSGVIFGRQRTSHGVIGGLFRTQRGGAENTWIVVSPEPGRAPTKHDEVGNPANCTNGLCSVLRRI